MSKTSRIRVWQWYFILPGVGVKIRYWTTWVAALLSGVLIGWAFTHGWGANQWGPIASWIAGLTTFLAVGVALYQTKLARDDAKQAKIDAAIKLSHEEQRHRSAIEAANQRLLDQMESQDRAVQSRTIVKLITSYQNQRTCARDLLEKIQRRKRMDGTGEPKAVIELQFDLYKQLQQSLDQTTVEAAFYVLDPETRSAIGLLEVQYEAVDTLLQKIYMQSHLGVRFQIGLDVEISELLDGLDDFISTAFTVARTNIAKLPSFKAEAID